MKSPALTICLAFLLALAAAGCAPFSTPAGGVSFPPAEAPPKNGEPPETGESPNLPAMTDAMARDMLETLAPAPGDSSPVILVDAEGFPDRESGVADKKRIVDRLRRNLNRAANGRLTFVDPRYFQALEKREETRKGEAGKQNAAPSVSPRADYRLEGTIALFDAPVPETGEAAVLYRLTFHLIEVESRRIVWSGAHAFREKPPQDVVAP